MFHIGKHGVIVVIYTASSNGGCPCEYGFFHIRVCTKGQFSRLVAIAFHSWPAIVPALFYNVYFIVGSVAMHGTVEYVMCVHHPLRVALAPAPDRTISYRVIGRYRPVEVDTHYFTVLRLQVLCIATYTGIACSYK